MKFIKFELTPNKTPKIPSMTHSQNPNLTQEQQKKNLQ